MPRHIAVVFVHGIYNSSDNSSDDFHLPMKARLERMPLNGEYAAEPRIQDFPVVSEGRWKRSLSTPFPAVATYAAHTGYWTHRPVIRGTAQLMTDLITADDPAPSPRRLFRRTKVEEAV